MRYIMKEKVFCLGDDYIVRDEDGNDRFIVDGKVFTLRQRLAVQDSSGNELALIQKKLLSWGPTYEIYRGDELSAVIKKQLFTFFRCRFTVDVPGPDDLEAAGDFMDKEYSFTRGSEEVARVSKRWFSFRDTYGIETDGSTDDVLIIASAVVIDLCCHEDQNR